MTNSENYTLSTHIQHTFTLSEDQWRQLAESLVRACAHWSPNTHLSEEGDALSFYPRFDPDSPALATCITLTPARWLSTLVSVCRTRPQAIDLKRWYALRTAVLSHDWLDRLDDAHLDLIMRVGYLDD